MTKTLAVLGSTGSIGVQALEVARLSGFEIEALTANSRTDVIEEQIREFHPRVAAVADEKAAAEAVQRIQEEFGDRAAAFQNLVNVDIVAAGCSKGTGAAKAKELFSIGKMGGIGDSFNDLPLIEAADVGFTFPTSPEALISAADHTVLSVSQAIETLEQES
jgi:hydroxymethylpyrimidine pyrophosphatase-like HAD family hydrolase